MLSRAPVAAAQINIGTDLNSPNAPRRSDRDRERLRDSQREHSEKTLTVRNRWRQARCQLNDDRVLARGVELRRGVCEGIVNDGRGGPRRAGNCRAQSVDGDERAGTFNISSLSEIKTRMCRSLVSNRTQWTCLTDQLVPWCGQRTAKFQSRLCVQADSAGDGFVRKGGLWREASRPCDQPGLGSGGAQPGSNGQSRSGTVGKGS